MLVAKKSLISSPLQILTFTSIVLGALYEGRQFIIVPGEANVTVSNQTTTDGKTDNFWLECNKGTKVQVFDTYDWEFKPEFDPLNKGPKVPPTIVKLIGGNDTGGATLNQPEAGWDIPALGSIFLTRNQIPLDLSNTTFHTSFPSGSTLGEAQNTAEPNKGAIIGGVTGGICVIALTMGVLIFLKKRQRSSPEPRAELQHTDLKVELQGNHYNNTPHELHAYEPPEIASAPSRIP